MRLFKYYVQDLNVFNLSLSVIDISKQRNYLITDKRYLLISVVANVNNP